MRAVHFIAALLVVSALWGCPEGSPPEPLTPPPAPVATLVKTVGQVSISAGEGGTPTQVQAPARLFAGDVVTTGPGASAVLRGGKVEIELDENTIFPVGSKLKQVTLRAGEVTLVGGDEALGLDTADGEATLSAGGRLRLVLREGSVIMELAEGELSLGEDDGGVTRAKAGQRVRLRGGSVELEDITDPVERRRLGLGSVEVETLDAPPEARASVEAGQPLLRRPGAARATPAPKSLTLPEGKTGFVTPAGALLRLEADGVVARVGPGASGVVENPSRDGKTVELPLSLDSGQVALQLGAGSRVRLGGSPAATLTSKEASATVSSTRGARRLDVLAGAVTLSLDGQPPMTVGAGQFITLGPGGAAEAKPAPRPALIVPFGKRVTLNTLSVKELGLRLPNRLVRVEVAADADFRQILLAGEAEDFVVAPVPASRQLFWRFPGDDGAAVQGQVRLRAEPQPRSGGTRGDMIAETGKKATVYYQGSVPPLTLTFNAVPEAKSYLLKVYAAGALGTPVLERKSETNKALIEAGALQEGSYVWFASPLDANGRELAGGRMNQMELVFDNALTTLVITSPRDGAKATDVVAAGTAPAGSKLLINGKPVPLGSSGRFSVPLGTVDTVVFTLVTPDGNEGLWLRRLKR